MGFKEWNERANQNWSVYMDRLEASVTTPASITPEFLKSSKAPDARSGIYAIGNITGIVTMGAITAGTRGQIVLAILLAVLASAPGFYHERRGKRILEQRAAATPAPAPSADA